MRKGGSYVVREIGTIERAGTGTPAAADGKAKAPAARTDGRKRPAAEGRGKRKET